MDKQTLKSSPLLSATSMIGSPGGAAASSRNLGFAMQRQTQDQWCWSAVSVSTSHFYDPASPWSQCGLVGAELGAAGCCQNGSTPACNQPWRLDLALQRTGNLSRWVQGAARYTEVQQEIDNSNPLGARVGWAGGGGHFVILDGYDRGGGETVSVQDPWYGSSTYPYGVFKTRYQGSGSWTHSYFTRP